MEEAERFDWLVAMDAGKVLAAGIAGRTQGGHQVDGRIEEAFIALLSRAEPKPDNASSEFRRAGRTITRRVITARDLTRRFGDFTAVDHVSFSIERGEIFGFLGSNGCGKTTTMKMLTGLLPATTGEAFLFWASRSRRPT